MEVFGENILVREGRKVDKFISQRLARAKTAGVVKQNDPCAPSKTEE